MSLAVTSTLNVKSPAFSTNEYIPAKYTCDGANINPSLTIENIPKNTVSLALVMEDPDAPYGTFDHWIMWNIPVTNTIEEDSAPGVQGKNSENKHAYSGPCPPSGVHHYHFRLFALNCKLNLPNGTDKKMLLKAMDNHVLAHGELVGLYKGK
ncbi:MAG TPA: YbhB/YbcL family Raf kinase inhibitor-like protein [Flavobacteriales bacterium]|nr:YbhB/YbcL family Raf kinase inhibitor-like protein [Flavobacteriales bacterium]